MFFTDYRESVSIPAEDASPRELDSILQMMNRVLRRPENFLGIVDRRDITLQFMVNDDLTIHVDVPMPERGGSLVKTSGLSECLELVKSLDDPIDYESIPDMEFQTWGFDVPKKPWWKFW